MTRDEARRRAVDAIAAIIAGIQCEDSNTPFLDCPGGVGECSCRYFARQAFDLAERAMADAGWRMVRVVEKIDIPDLVAVPKWLKAGEMAHISAVGWNACRAAMLAEDG